MDRAQKEMTDKIRSAIKNKLTQMNAFVDDELPDYIMILIANKRSKAHIEKDLSLFLGSETTEFSQWLNDLLLSLKSTPAGTSSSPAKVKKSNTFGRDQFTTDNDDDDDVLALDPQELEGDFLSQELSNEEYYPICNAPPVILEDKSIPKKSVPTPVVKPEPTALHEFSSKRECVKLTPKAVKVYPIQQVVKSPMCSSVIPVKRTQSIQSEDQYDPLNPSVGNVSSVVRVTERKYNVPASLQANKLLLRAVDDATKSVLGGKDLNEYYKPTPIKVLTSDRHQDSFRKTVYGDNEFEFERNSISYVDSASASLFSESDSLSPEDSQSAKFELTTPSADSPEEFNFQSSDAGVLFTRQTINPNVSSIDHEFVSTNRDVCTPKKRTAVLNSPNKRETESTTSPHFIVTLEGVDLKSLKRKRAMQTCGLYSESDKDDDLDEDIGDDSFGEMIDEDNMMDVDVSPKKQKVLEKCRYWPSCKSGNDCPYHHPMAPCKLFPKCKFGDSCFYIHPKCRFDTLCSKKDCPFTHTSKRKPLGMPKPAMLQKMMTSNKTICRYFPHCVSRTCPFVHPTLCWYGRDCQSSTCTYSHLNVPPRNQLKWHA